MLEGLYDNRVADHLESLHQKCLVDFHCGMSDDKIECRKWENPVGSMPFLSLETPAFINLICCAYKEHTAAVDS